MTEPRKVAVIGQGMPDTVLLHPHDEKLDALLLAEALYEGTPHLQNLAEKLARQHGKAQALPPFILLGESLRNYWVLLAEEIIAHSEHWLPNQGSACLLAQEERDRIHSLPTHPLVEKARREKERPFTASPAAITTKRKKDGPHFTRRFKLEGKPEQPKKEEAPSVAPLLKNKVLAYHFAFGWCYAPENYHMFDVVEISLEADEIQWRTPDGIPMKSTRPSIAEYHIISCGIDELSDAPDTPELCQKLYGDKLKQMEPKLTFWNTGLRPSVGYISKHVG